MGFLDKLNLNKMKNVIPGKKEDKSAKNTEDRSVQKTGEAPANRTYAEPAAPRQQAPPKVKTKPAANHGDPWTVGEEKHVMKSYDSGMSIEAIAEEHGRTREAIAHRLIKLGYKDVVTTTRHKYGRM